jgi:hypothetical protein
MATNQKLQGTGRRNEWWTNLKFWLKKVEPWTLLKGRCHTGFYGGMFDCRPLVINEALQPQKERPFRKTTHCHLAVHVSISCVYQYAETT